MKKLWPAEAVALTFFALFCFATGHIIGNDSESEIFMLNMGSGCGLKAAGVWADILSEKEHTHLGIRLKVSFIAAVILFVFAISQTSLGFFIVVCSYFGVMIVFVYDLILFVLCRTAAFLKKKFFTE